MQISRRELLIVPAGLALVGCRNHTHSYELEGMAVGIGTSDASRIPALVAEARQRGASPEQLLSAAWLAALRFCELADVHPILVLPAIARLQSVASKDGDEAWRAVGWAVANVNSWRGPSRRADPKPPARTSEATLVAAMQASDEEAARAHGFALCERLGAEATLDLLCREATEPRDDPHAAIYAAQVTRFLGSIAADQRPLVLSHLAAFLAARRRWPHFDEAIPVGQGPGSTAGPDLAMDTAWLLCADEHASLTGLSEQTIFDALALLAHETRIQDLVIGGDVHPTTHLDAMAMLYRRSPPAERPRVLASCVRANLRRRTRRGTPAAAALAVADSSGGVVTPGEALQQPGGELRLRSAQRAARGDLAGYRREVARRMADHGADEHGFKYWAALDALSEVVSAPARIRLWSGLSLHYAAGKLPVAG